MKLDNYPEERGGGGRILKGQEEGLQAAGDGGDAAGAWKFSRKAWEIWGGGVLSEIWRWGRRDSPLPASQHLERSRGEKGCGGFDTLPILDFADIADSRPIHVFWEGVWNECVALEALEGSHRGKCRRSRDPGCHRGAKGQATKGACEKVPCQCCSE